MTWGWDVSTINPTNCREGSGDSTGAMIGCCSILWSPFDPYEPTNSFDDTSSHQMSKEIARAPELVEIYWG